MATQTKVDRPQACISIVVTAPSDDRAWKKETFSDVPSGEPSPPYSDIHEPPKQDVDIAVPSVRISDHSGLAVPRPPNKDVDIAVPSDRIPNHFGLAVPGPHKKVVVFAIPSDIDPGQSGLAVLEQHKKDVVIAMPSVAPNPSGLLVPVVHEKELSRRGTVLSLELGVASMV